MRLSTALFMAVLSVVSAVPAEPANLTIETVQGIHSSPPSTSVGKVLVGPGATGSFAGHENEIAKPAANSETWEFNTPPAGSEVLDTVAVAKYFYANVSANARRVWMGSKWAPISPAEPRWRGVAILFTSYQVTPADNFGMFQLQALSTATLTLPDPDDNPAVQGMAIVIEQADELFSSATTVEVDSDRPIRLPDGSETTSWEVPHSTGLVSSHTFRLTAGTQFSAYAWYVTEGP